MLNVLLTFFETVLGSYPFLLMASCAVLFVKGYILTRLIIQGGQLSATKKTWSILLCVLIGSMISDSAWALKIIHNWLIPSIGSESFDYRILLFWIRIAWAFSIIQYQALALFIEHLIEQRPGFNTRQKIFISISSLFCLFFVGLAFFHFDCLQSSQRSDLECQAQQIVAIYQQFILILPTLLLTIPKFHRKSLPRILQKQFKIFIQFLIAPHLISDFIQLYPFNFFPTYIASSYAVVSLSTMLLTFAIYYSSKKIMALRFLNFKGHVESKPKFSFIDNFKEVLEQLSHATNIQELGHITQTYFKQAFDIPLRRSLLYIRKMGAQEINTNEELSKMESLIEAFLSTPDSEIPEHVRQAKILITDEIAFSNFYEKSAISNAILTFLENINADIFLPIYEKKSIIGYIIVDRNARLDEFYSDIERDEMLVFASYLGNVIHLIQNRNFEAIIHQEKELREELYSKHQEINQYKESIRSFLRNNRQKDIGIIFYKGRRFIFGNQAAKQLIKINVNTQEGHPITQALKKIARQVEEYKSPQTHFAKDAEGNKLVLSGVPNLEQNNVIITVYHPEISDIIKKQIDLLRNPTQWDYLLYLETTKSGQLINQLIPGSGETLLNFKIELLQLALRKKAPLLAMPEEDLLPTVELLHHISLRETLHILDLQGPETNFDTARKLFGLNPIFGLKKNSSDPLLKRLDTNGTLFIKNIHFLSLETQEHLAEFIKYGVYRIFKSDHKISSNVRIICSTTKDLAQAVHEGTFSKALFNELKKTTLSMPSLLTLPEHELSDLAAGFSEQALATQTFKNLLELTEKEKYRLAHQRPVSLQELKTKVQQLLIQKSKKNEIYQETQFDPAYEVTDPELIQAARLGKYALRDPKIMAMLWKKFNNQNKIATFLGVNRSSVNRRCKKYNLT